MDQDDELARARRRKELIDLPEVPLFFGRLDYEPGTVLDGFPMVGSRLAEDARHRNSLSTSQGRRRSGSVGSIGR